MMNRLKTYKFSELYEMSSGISSKKEQAGHGSPFLSFSTVFNNEIIPDELPDLMDTSDKEKKTYSIIEGDIFLTRTSETLDELGMSSVAVKDYPNASYSGFLKRLRPLQKDVTYAKFMAFYLRSYLFRKAMNNNAIMTLRASLNEQIFSYLDLILPSYKEQVKIGDLFYKISEKIEVNNKINKELEAMAKTLYDYWFVQFDFPDENGKPYKSSGGKMVYNEELKREIPEGWKDGTIGDIGDLTRGVTYSKKDIKTSIDKGVTPILRATNISGNVVDLDNMVYVPDEFVRNNQVLNQYDIIITMSSGSKDHIGKNGFYYFEKKVGFGAFCAKLAAKENFRYYLYSFTQSDFMFETIKNESLGTNINNLNNSLVNGFKLVMPPTKVLKAFNRLSEPFYKKIASNLQENQKLAELRDWLLPMLMNGQISVGEAEERLSMVAEARRSEERRVGKEC